MQSLANLLNPNSKRMVVFSNITVHFANITDPDPRVKYSFHCTTTDKIMNKVCGALLILYMLIGTVVCIHLIHFYKENRNSWLDRFLYLTSIARLLNIITNCLYVAYELLNKKPPTQILEVEKWGIAVFILSYFTCYGVIALDTAMVATQYCNIHRPEWTLVNSRSIVLKRVLRITIAVVLCCYSFAMVFKIRRLDNGGNFEFPIPKGVIEYRAISLAPHSLMAFLILCIYATTWVRFCQRSGEMRVGRIVRGEFKLVILIALGDVICSVIYVAFVVNLALTTLNSFRSNMYIRIFSETILPMTIEMSIILYMFFRKSEIKFCLIRKCFCCKRRTQYEELN